MTNNDGNILISIVIVNYKVPYCLVEALDSLRLARLYDCCEVIIVDNASGDGSQEIVNSRFQEVRWIQLKNNIGFGRACNIGAEAARGEYLLLLNPDAVVSTDTLANAVEFMETHPSTGLMGPKILNPDGTLQLSCRRSIPTPSVAFYYFAGLSNLFPKSRRFGRYNLTYMDENETVQVGVISGSFMFMRLKLFSDIGGFDKRFFMYGEDIDLCYRITRAGHEVWYYPEIQIVHQKGKSSAKRRVRSRINFYGAMIIFLQKYRSLQGTHTPRWLTWVGIVFLAMLNIGAMTLRSIAAPLVDVAALNYILRNAQNSCNELINRIPGSNIFECSPEPFYAAMPLMPPIVIHAAISFVFVFLFTYNNVYSAKLHKLRNLFFSGIMSSAIVMSGVHFLTDYPKFEFGLTLVLSMFFFVFWRAALSGPETLWRFGKNIFKKH